MFNNSSHIDASHSTFSEVHRDQYYSARTTVQGNQTVNNIVQGNQIIQDSRSSLVEALYRASAPSAAHDSAQRYPAPKCIEGTRIELLTRLTSWADEPDKKPICWLHGRPGSGKSAVSQTIAEKYASEKRLAASFFFSRRDLERRAMQYVVPTLATQLLAFLPSIHPAVIAALERDYMIPMKVLREQMEKLLFGPLSTATETPESPILIIVDALDECDDQSLVSELVTLLTLLPHKTSLPLRLLITSRAEPWIQSRFHSPDIAALTQHLDIHTFTVDADIRSFLRRSLDEIYEQYPQVMQDITRPWPSEEELERIVNKAGGLFIFALTVIKFVGAKTHNPILRLQAIIEDTASESADSAYADLDSLYRDAISTFPDPDIVRLVLGLVYCMTIPMTISGLHSLLQRPEPNVDVRLVVPALSSVLLASEDGKQPIQFYHASFRDFLINHQRSRKYTINSDVYHRFMAQLCLEFMSNSLKRDMCGVGDPAVANCEIPDLAERRSEKFDEALLYACRYWSHHLAQLPNDGIATGTLLSALKTFNTTVLLYWIESLSLLGEMENGVVMLRQCIRWLKTLPEVPEDQLTLIEEAERMMVLYMDCISECALHVYVTAISFVLKDSIIYKTFSHQSYGTLVTHPDRIENWASVRRGLDLHHPIHSIAFSPDGNFIATASTHIGVQVWNTIIGGNVASFGDHPSTAHLVCYSPSGSFLAAAFEGGTVAMWDPKVGRKHMGEDGCHTEQITCLQFSDDSTLLASGSRDHTIRVWSVEGAQSLYHLTKHEKPITSLVFSNDSSQLFSGAEDHLIIVWDMSTGKAVRGMMGHQKVVNCLAVTKDGKTIASGSEDKTVKIWDVTSGKCTKTYSKHHTGIRSVRFFDQDKFLITACDEVWLSWNLTLRNASEMIWDLERTFRKALKHSPAWQAKMIGWGIPKPALRYAIHESEGSNKTTTPSPRLKAAYATGSSSFVFSRQRAIFAGTLPNQTNGLSLNATGEVTSVAISSDGNWAATSDTYGALYILDLTAPQRTWEDIDVEVRSHPLVIASQIIPSTDGKRFVMDSALQWYLVNEDCEIIKKFDTGLAGSMRDDGDIRFTFSWDGSVILCVISSIFNDDKTTLRILDPAAGELRMKFTGLKRVHSFVASANGHWAACGHGPGQLDVFGLTDKQRTNIVGESSSSDSPINALIFSRDAQLLIGGSQSGIVRAWDRESGECRAILETSTSRVMSLARSVTPNGVGRIAIGREDGSICLWSPSTSNATHDVVTADQAAIKNVDVVQFSDDLSKLTSRGENGIVSRWVIPLDGDGADMTRCSICLRQEDSTEGEPANKKTLPHLISQSDPDEAIDDLFQSSYRVRKDGWLVKDDRRVIWIPPSARPRSKNWFFAYETGQIIFSTPSGNLAFIKWVDKLP